MIVKVTTEQNPDGQDMYLAEDDTVGAAVGKCCASLNLDPENASFIRGDEEIDNGVKVGEALRNGDTLDLYDAPPLPVAIAEDAPPPSDADAPVEETEA